MNIFIYTYICIRVFFCIEVVISVNNPGEARAALICQQLVEENLSRVAMLVFMVNYYHHLERF